MGIGKEADVENQIGIRGHAVAITKTHDGNEHGALVGILEALGDEMAKLVHVELRSVDDHVRKFVNVLHHRTFLAQALAHGDVLAERVRAPRLAVAAQKRVFAGIDEHQSDGMILAQVLEKWRQFFELRALARVYQQGSARKIAFASGMQLGKNGNQVDGKVVDAVEAHVFESMEYGAFSGAGKSGKNDELAGFASRCLFHRARPLSFSPGAGGCWGCAY